jgi:flavin reductase (DIM6/NTAB) family NADH-FMN oxidoreductase RutF
MTIHSEHPFLEEDDPVRRFRGRVGGAVSLWTAGDETSRSGLTVSSFLVVNGAPACLVGALDPDSDLAATLTGTGRGVVQLLAWADHDLADAFGGVAPAPGGPFRLGTWEQTGHGPALAGRTRALVHVVRTEEVGWSLLVVAAVDRIELSEEDDALEHRRGRYRRTGSSDR